MKRLTEIGIKTGTDKAHYHKYTEYYDDIFSQYTSPRILEIGVLNSNSISMYLQYFENPYIIGVDIDNKEQYTNDKWKFVQADQTKIEDLQKVVQDQHPFDIILDDGGHTMKQQQISFGFLIDYVKPGGYYIIEDLHTSTWPTYKEKDCTYTSLEMLDRMSSKQIPFSNYIPEEQQKTILNKIKSIEIFTRIPDNFEDSVTSIIKIKNLKP